MLSLCSSRPASTYEMISMSRWPCVPKPIARLHAVLVDHAQRAETHVRRIVVVGEREAVERVEPAVLRVAALTGAADFHDDSLTLRATRRDMHGERPAHAVAHQASYVAGRRGERAGSLERSSPKTAVRSRKASATATRVAARGRRDRREPGGQAGRRRRSPCRARPFRSHSGSTRRSPARDARSILASLIRSRTVASRRCGSFCEPSIAICCVRCGNARIAEAREELRAVRGEIDAARHVERRTDLGRHHPLDQRREHRVGRGLPQVFVPQQIAEVRERRMAAVQQTQLHRFERRDVGDHARPRPPTPDAAAAKAILDHPIAERLGDDRRAIGDAEQVRGSRRCRHPSSPERCDRPSCKGTRRARAIQSASAGSRPARTTQRDLRACGRCAAGCRSRRR